MNNDFYGLIIRKKQPKTTQKYGNQTMIVTVTHKEETVHNKIFRMMV